MEGIIIVLGFFAVLWLCFVAKLNVLVLFGLDLILFARVLIGLTVFALFALSETDTVVVWLAVLVSTFLFLILMLYLSREEGGENGMERN